MNNRHLLDIADLDRSEIFDILERSRRTPASLGAPLAGLGVALIFEKPSNRTRHSMEIAVIELGGHPVYTRGEEIGLDTREPVEDIAAVMAGYHRVIAARVFQHDQLRRMVAAVDANDQASPTSVLNMLSDHSHPLQAVADALTMMTEFGDLEGRKVAWVGDYNNVARSLAEICARLGMEIAIACPDGFGPSASEVDRIVGLGATRVDANNDPVSAVAGACAVHTDTWVSMGDEQEATERKQRFVGFQVDQELMRSAAPAAIFMHCLPAYRGLEVSETVIDGPASRVVSQAHNRLNAARGVLHFLVSGDAS
jgi:ornithine carbamoyltransferase